MEVRQNGYVIKTLGPQFTTGTLLNVPVTLCQNYPFELVWTVVGTVPTRVKVSIINNAPFSQTIYTKPTTVLSLGQLYATSFNCSQAACLDPTNLTKYINNNNYCKIRLDAKWINTLGCLSSSYGFSGTHSSINTSVCRSNKSF